MGNSLRCCLACVLPCGALDVVRIVHLNGHVKEYNRKVSAGDVLAAHPNHVLSKPCYSSHQVAGVDRRIFVVSPDSDLKRGHIYFLIPSSALSDQKKNATKDVKNPKKRVRVVSHGDGCLPEIIPPEKRSSRQSRRRRSGRIGVWRPHLESICEDL